MSGTNKLIQSANAMKNGGNSALIPCLENANEEAIKIMGQKAKKQKSSKKK